MEVFLEFFKTDLEGKLITLEAEETLNSHNHHFFCLDIVNWDKPWIFKECV